MINISVLLMASINMYVLLMAIINISVMLMASIKIYVLLMAIINISVLLMASINISVLLSSFIVIITGADPGFQVRGGAFKIIFFGISCAKSRFYAKKSYLFPILGGARAGCAPPWIRPCIRRERFIKVYIICVICVVFYFYRILSFNI